MPDYKHFRRFFAEADRPSNIAAYHAYVAPFLDEPTRSYWEGRDLTLRRRIGGFRKGIYKRGLLGGFIGMLLAVGIVHAPTLERALMPWIVASQRSEEHTSELQSH